MKALGLNLALVFIAVFVTLLLFESFLRYRIGAWPFESEPVQYPRLTEKDASLRWRFSPEGGRNSLGLRNEEVDAKEAGEFRILYLGDSMVWNSETTSDSLYTEVIEWRLNEAMATDGRRIEVINAGIPGYTTYQELEFLKIYGLDMQPDAVVLGFVFNDVYYPYLHKPTESKMLGSDPGLMLNKCDPDGFLGGVFSRTYIASYVCFAAEVAGNRWQNRPIYPFERRHDFFLAWKPYGWHKTKEVLAEMKALLESRGIPLMVVIYPVSDQVNDTYLRRDRGYVLYPQQRIKEICETLSIPYYDLTEAIYQQGNTALYEDYLHFNGKGNDIVAQEVSEFLLTNRTFWLSTADSSAVAE